MTCYRHDRLGRVLVGRHDDGCPGGPDHDGCHGCQLCPGPHCQRCHQAHATDVCAGCLGLIRVDLHSISTLADRLPTEAVVGRPAYHIHSGIPGGEAVVLLSPGHHDPHLAALEPRPPAVVLDHWAVHWWQALGSGEPVVIKAPVVHSLVAYLDRVLSQLTGLASFLDMADDLATTVRRLEDVLHEGERPERSRVPCWECGTRLVKVYTAQVRSDHWLCPRCGELYDQGRYERAKHDHLASAGANRYVSVSDATVAIGRPAQTVRSWLRRGLVDTAKDPRTGRLQVWWPDVRNLHLSTGTRERPKPGP